MFNIGKETYPIKAILVLITFLFICLGLISIFHHGDGFLLGNMEEFNNDDVKYIRSAQTFLETKVFTYQSTTNPTVYIMPGLTIMLAFFMSIFGFTSGIIAFKIFQVLLQALSIYLIFLIGRKVFNSQIGLIASFIDFLYTVELYASNLILTEVIFKFLLLLLIYITLWAVEEKKLRLYLLGGFVWVLAIYLRPTIGAFPLVVFVLWLKQNYSLQEILKFSFSVLLIFVICLSPWWIRNYVTFDRFIPLTLSSGNPFLQGTFIHYDQRTGWIPYEISSDEIQLNANETKAGLERLKTYFPQSPFKFLYWYTLGKTLFFWATPFYWQKVLGIPYILVYLYHPVVLFFGIYGLIKSRQFKAGHSLGKTFLFLTLVYFNLVYLPFYTFSRYSFPVMPLVMIFAAYGFSVKFPRLTRKILSKLS